MRIALVSLLTLPAVAGCYHSVFLKTTAELPAESRVMIEKNESYYLGKAREQAVFSLSCPAEQVKPTIVSTKACELKGYVEAQRTAYYVQHGTCVSTIGVEGCGQRKTYEVICGPHQGYRSGYWVNDNVSEPPCDVVATGEAVRAITRNNLEQQALDEQAVAAGDEARHRQQEQQRRDQQQQQQQDQEQQQQQQRQRQ